MHFIITGGAGFIGSHVAEQLLLEGHFVTVVDNLSTGSLQNLPQHYRLKFLFKDILDCQPKDFDRPVHGIAHLAATPSVPQSWHQPLAAHHNNLSTTIAVIQLCQALHVPRLVFASSAAVYGNPNLLPIEEAQAFLPISPYGLQKLASEQYASLFADQFGFSFVALRLFNVFGPRQVANSGYSGVISIFTNAILQGAPITIYGDGTQTRDFIYVKDVAIAFSKALMVQLPVGSYIPCNAGTRKATSLLNLVNILKNCLGCQDLKINFAEARAGDIQHSQADISRMKLILDFVPQWSVESGIAQLIESYSILDGLKAS